MRWYRQAAERGSAAAMNNIGALYQYGRGVPQNYGEAMRWYRQAAERGNLNAVNNIRLSLTRRVSGSRPDYGEAMRWYHQAADRGNVTAMSNIGVLYQDGLGVPKDLGTAVAWYRRAADLLSGAKEALARLGRQ